MIRAIEMRVLAGKTGGRNPSVAGAIALQGYDVLKIGLLATARQRSTPESIRAPSAMVAAGWMEEARGLIARNISPDSKPFQFIGYAELREHILGRLPLQQAVEQIQQATRRFAKRQITWFRKEPNVHWLSGFGNDPATVASAFEVIRGNVS